MGARGDKATPFTVYVRARFYLSRPINLMRPNVNGVYVLFTSYVNHLYMCIVSAVGHRCPLLICSLLKIQSQPSVNRLNMKPVMKYLEKKTSVDGDEKI